MLNDYFKVRGRVYFLYKIQGKNKIYGIFFEEVLVSLRRGFQDIIIVFIYYCQNYYFCLMGFEDIFIKCIEVYA